MMDEQTLYFFNTTLANPVLDWLMVFFTTIGLVVLPVVAVWFRGDHSRKQVVLAVSVTVAVGFVFALTFQLLSRRPRPEDVRLVLATPSFYSFPSGHAVISFAIAMLIGLSRRTMGWWSFAMVWASLVAASRIYLGHHYPTDVVGGMILGVSIGAGIFGIVMCDRPRWEWLLWPQIGIVCLITEMAYLDRLPKDLLKWPFADKVLHFLLFGMIVFWLNLWLNGRLIRWRKFAIPLAILLPLTLATLEECLQALSPVRSASIWDWVSDVLGMTFFWWLSGWFLRSTE